MNYETLACFPNAEYLFVGQSRLVIYPRVFCQSSVTCNGQYRGRDVIKAQPSCLEAISFPELRSPWRAVGKRELWEQPCSNNKGNNQILPIRLHCAVSILYLRYLWRMPEMVAPKALVFQLLLKGNEDWPRCWWGCRFALDTRRPYWIWRMYSRHAARL